MKKCTRLISIVLVFAILITALPVVSASAASATQYIKEVRMSTASTEANAKKWLTDNGYTVLDVNLNKGSNKDAVYLGYLTTTDPDEAITDMSLMQMDGGYSFSEYGALVERRKQEIGDMLDTIEVAVKEARANLVANKTAAKIALEMLNRFKEDDSGKLLGDFLLKQEASREDLVKVFLQGNSLIVTLIHTALSLACTDNGDDTNWLKKLESVDPYAYYDESIYSDVADTMFAHFRELNAKILEYETYYKAEMAKERDLNAEVETDGKSLDKAQIAILYISLENTQYNGQTLLDFFKRDPKEVDTEEFYPLLSTMTEGQRSMVQFAGIENMIFFAQSDDEDLLAYQNTYLKRFETEKISGTVSIYFGVDRSLFDGGVALTSASLRKYASTGDGSWIDNDNIDPALNIALHVVVGAALAAATGVGIAAVMKFININSEAYQISTLARAYSDALWGGATSLTKAEIAQCDRMVAQQIAAGSKTIQVVGGAIVGICLGISLIVEGIIIGIKLYNYYHPEYSEIPRIMVDEVLTDEDSYYINYYAVRDQAGELGDLNAWKAQRWNALYTTKDKNAGNPITAAGFCAKVNDNKFPKADSEAVHYFGETAPANVNRYHYKRTAPAIYIFYDKDNTASLAASTFSGGQIAMFTGFGLIGGLFVGCLGTLGTGKMKSKKKETEAE